MRLARFLVPSVLLVCSLQACIYVEQEDDGEDPPDRGPTEESEPNDAPARAQDLPPGETVHGSIGAGDTDWWRLELAAGETASLQLFGTRLDQDGWSLTPPTLSVVAPDGVSPLWRQGSAGAPTAWGVVDPDVPAFCAESAGSYYVVVAAEDGISAGGEYLLLAQAVGESLALELEPPGVSGDNDSHALAEPFPAGVLYGYHARGESDWYALDVTEPTQLAFATLAYRNGVFRDGEHGFDAELALFDEDGTELARNDDGLLGDSLLGFVCPRPARLFLRVDEASPSSDAPYFLIQERRALAGAALESEPDDTPSSAAYVRFDTLVLGELLPGDVDWFAVPGFAGDRLELWIWDRGRHADARGTVEAEFIDGRSQTLPMDRGATLGVRTALLGADDTYFLRLSSPEPSGTPYAFELRLQLARFEEEPNDLLTQAQPLDARGRAAGRIDRPGDQDLYAFEAQAGEPVLFECFADDEFGPAGFAEMSGDGSDLDPLLEVRDPSGRVVASSSALPRTALGLVHGRATVSLALVPRSSGRFTLAVSDARGGSGPTYTYALQQHGSR